jgi:PAS domain-containing protein
VRALVVEDNAHIKLDWLEVRIIFAERRVADLVERARTADALQQSEARFRSLVQHASDMIVVIDAEGKRTYASPSMERLVGTPPRGLVGTSLSDTFWVDREGQTGAEAFFRHALAHPGQTLVPEWLS